VSSELKRRNDLKDACKKNRSFECKEECGPHKPWLLLLRRRNII